MKPEIILKPALKPALKRQATEPAYRHPGYSEKPPLSKAYSLHAPQKKPFDSPTLPRKLQKSRSIFIIPEPEKEDITEKKSIPERKHRNLAKTLSAPVLIPILKAANRYIRWNLLWFFFFCVVFIPLPLWLYPLNCLAGYIVITIVNLWMCLVLIVCIINAGVTMVRLYRSDNKDWIKEYPAVQPANSLVHLVVICGFKEPLDLIIRTLDSLKNQTVSNRLFVVVGLEEGTPDFEFKEQRLCEIYHDTFLHIMVTRHPKNLPAEIPGKCSNSNFAARYGVKQMKAMGLYDIGACTATSCDTDNLFHAKYFEYLGLDFVRREDRFEVVWQAPLFYNYHLDQRPFFVRVTGILRSIFMMGILTPQSINTMSVTSLSMDLLENGRFYHPGYQMDDIIDTLVRMTAIHKRIKIVLIPHPVISGPTSGETFKQELVEWARQARRWTIGAAEVFHYFCIKFSTFDTFAGIRYAIVFTHYYGFVICAMSLFNINGLISMQSFQAAGYCSPSEYLPIGSLEYIPAVGIVFPYIVFALAFVIDALARRLLKVKEEINIVRNILHWISTPFVLLAYSLIEFYAISEIALRGKDVCKHGASKKTGLVMVV